MIRKALCIGIDRYDHNHIPNLRNCSSDAKDVQETLKTNGNDGSPNFDVMLLTSQSQHSISRKTLREGVIKLFQEDCDVCLFYFSGHGYADKTGGYLVTSDCNSGDEGLSFHDILSLASQSCAKNKILILDCCNSGGVGNIPLFGDFSIIKEGMVILAACQEEQSALEERDHGVFTELLLDALRGSTDLLGNVTPGEVYAYIDKALGPREQRPIFKANVTRFIPLRKNKPHVSLEDLRNLSHYFKDPEYEYHLDPTYEPMHKKCKKENKKIFKTLQDYNRAGLVVPVGAEHMYYAAIESKSCKLTPLGKCYWKLASKKRI